MKRYAMMLPKIGFTAAIFITAIFIVASWVNAQDEDPAPVKVHVTFDQATYNLGDPNENISAVITVTNNSPDPVWTKKGFSELGYHLYLYFNGPLENDPKLITAVTDTGAGSPTPSVPPTKELVEDLSPGTSDPEPWLINMDITELRDYYQLTEPGQYKVWFSMPFVQYDPNQVEPVYDDDNTTIIGYVAPSDAVIWTEPIDTPDTYITLVTGAPPVSSDINVIATEYTFGEGPRPGMTKKPLTGVEIRLYEKSDIQAAGISKINYKTYADIATNGVIPYKIANASSTPGEFIFSNVMQSECLVIAYAANVTDYKHVGSPAKISVDDPGWGNGDIVRKLTLLTNYRGKKSPGKSTELKNYGIFIIQPEYVEWSTNEELYPIGFESLGNSDVEVLLEPPPGFVADQTSLSGSVSKGLKAFQFTVTDVEGTWKSTKVNYKVKKKKKTKEISDKIGVKLTRKLAKIKGVGEWGVDDQVDDGDDQDGQDDDLDGQDDDLDGDTYLNADDCDDGDAAVNPGAAEVPYNGKDDDCDPATLDDDLDGDTYLNADDCDDGDAAVNPGAAEVPYNGKDDDCDPATLDDDLDGDTYLNADDCDDSDAAVNPGAAEVPYNGKDDDCDPATFDDGQDDPGPGKGKGKKK